MYTVEAFIPYREPEDPEHSNSYPVWLGTNTLLAILPSVTVSIEASMTLQASYDLIDWFTVQDECEVIQFDSLYSDQSITLDPRIMLPYPYLKISLPVIIPANGYTLILSIGAVT